MTLRCTACDAVPGDDALACAGCGELLAFWLDAAAIDAHRVEANARARRESAAPADRSGVWRFRELLPPVAPANIITLREGDVPL